MESRRCAACGQAFRPRPQVPQQCYCAAPACQRERRRRWQQAKRQSDPHYQDNQTRAQRVWARRNPDYWRGYLAKLLDNKQVVRYLKQRQPEVLAEFETIVQTVSLEQ